MTRRRMLIVCLFLMEAVILRAQAPEEGQSLLFLPEQNQTDAGIGIQFRQEDDAFNPALGKGLILGEFLARSRHSLDSTRRVQGLVSYQRGVKQAVNWNTSSDWDLLFPYITIDTVGGNLQKEQYRFAARYASRRRQFFYSLRTDYRALHEWRDTDPRPHNVVSDLQLTAAAGLVTGKYALSLECTYRKYHQANNVEFLNQRGNNTSVIHYLGLGRFSSRFSGAKKTMNTRFQGNGFSLHCLLEPVLGEGWIGGADYEWTQVTRHLPDYNEAPVSQLLIQGLSAYVGIKDKRSFIRADMGVHHRLGRENLIDATSAFNAQGGLALYSEKRWNAGISLFREWSYARTKLSVAPAVQYLGTDARNRHTGASYTYHYLDTRLAGSSSLERSKWNYKFGLSMDAILSLHHSMSPGSQEMDWRFQDYADHFHERRRDSRLHIAGNARIGRQISRQMVLYVSPEFGYSCFLPSRHWRTDAVFYLGILF